MAMKIDPDMCTACGDCKPVCPTKSISSGKIFFKIDASHLHGMRRPQRLTVVCRRLPVQLHQPGLILNVIPAHPEGTSFGAQAGIQKCLWVPACAGTTSETFTWSPSCPTPPSPPAKPPCASPWPPVP